MQEEDRALRPTRLSEFIGQEDLRTRLSVSLEAARMRQEPLDHVLFSGPPGLGKTTLANIVAKEMGGRMHSTAAPALSRPRDLAKLLSLLESGDVLFLDEIHRLNRPCEEILYPAMEDGYIDFIVGEGVTAQSIKVHLQPFTLIGATTRSGMLSAPLKARFGFEFKMEYYEPEEIASVIRRTATLLSLDFDAAAARTTAGRSRRTPRAANRLVRRIRDYATVEGISRIKANYCDECLDRLGIDTLGLNETDRKLLRILIERYRGGPAGLRTLAALLDEEERTLEEDHEPFLMRCGLLEKTAQGRMATNEAFIHLGIKNLTANARATVVGSGTQSELFSSKQSE